MCIIMKYFKRNLQKGHKGMVPLPSVTESWQCILSAESGANVPASGAQFLSRSPQVFQLASSQDWGRKYGKFAQLRALH
jgi:hypothetical protein